MAERWGSGVVAAIGAAAGGVSGAAGCLVAGSDRLPVGTLAGVVTGAVVSVALWWAVRDTALAADYSERPDPVRPLRPGTAPRGAAAGGTTDGLVDTIGRQFDDLARQQLTAVERLRVAPGDLRALDGASKVALRTRRKAASLQILATGGPSDTAGRDATDEPVAEVLRRALADSDQAHRVDVSSLHDATIDRVAVADVAHLMAELIDNAVAGSTEPVTVLGRRAHDSYVLSVVDEGPGLSAEERRQANARLSDPPPLGGDGTEAFGLSVAGRLAARHGIVVQLLEAATDGLVAKVRLPLELIDGGRRVADDEPALDGGAGDDDVVVELTDPTVDATTVGATDATIEQPAEVGARTAR